ncbi:MAG: ADP-ribosylation factor-directed GTPase activating protein isoform b [Pirellulaceae bacterium]|nr:ADP-ribosylation factor-directed GTPase activating protein isoform b [Pirellulaceae bacterium]
MSGCNERIGDNSAKSLEDAISNADDASIQPDLKQRIAKILDDNLHGRLLSAETNAAWQIMHGVVAYGDNLPLEIAGSRENTLEFLLNGGVVNGWELAPGDALPATGRTGLKARLEPGSYIGQGHVDQWLAILSQTDVPLSRKVLAREKEFTVLDWARQAQWDVSDNPIKEYSWTIIALTRYFPDERSWTAKDGKTWTFEPLAAFESKQDLGTSPCGGMHRLMGLAHAVEFQKRHGDEITGGWKLAEEKVLDSIRRIKEFQNRDGSFSTNHTDRPGTSADLSTVISSTGHTIEFLSFALPKEQLEEAWLVKAVDRLCTLLEAVKNADLDCGGLYHALNGLKLYYSRRYEPWRLTQSVQVAIE